MASHPAKYDDIYMIYMISNALSGSCGRFQASYGAVVRVLTVSSDQPNLCCLGKNIDTAQGYT